MSEARHSKLPWVAKPVPDGMDFRAPGPAASGACGPDFYFEAADGICPGIIWDYLAEGKANADLVLRAVNSHDALVSALKALDAVIDFSADPEPGIPFDIGVVENPEALIAAFANARAALSLATGETK